MVISIHDALALVLALIAGLGIGLFYFGGLWLTVRRLPEARQPALLMFGSFLGRTAASMIGIFLVMGGELARLLACLAGIIIARLVLVRRLSPEPPAGGGMAG